MTLEIQVQAWDRCKNMAGLNWLMGSQPSPLVIWISNSNTYINKRSKTCTDSLLLKNTTYHNKNECQHKRGQCNSSVNECSQLTDYGMGVKLLPIDQWLVVDNWSCKRLQHHNYEASCVYRVNSYSITPIFGRIFILSLLADLTKSTKYKQPIFRDHWTWSKNESIIPWNWLLVYVITVKTVKTKIHKSTKINIHL